MRRKYSRWRFLRDELWLIFDVVRRVVVPISVVFVLLVAPIVVLALWVSYSTCARICAVNGDENGWEVWVGCFCKDQRGLYTPTHPREACQPSKDGP